MPPFTKNKKINAMMSKMRAAEKIDKKKQDEKKGKAEKRREAKKKVEVEKEKVERKM